MCWREVAEGCEIRWSTGLEVRLNSQSGYLVKSHKTGNCFLTFYLSAWEQAAHKLCFVPKTLIPFYPSFSSDECPKINCFFHDPIPVLLFHLVKRHIFNQDTEGTVQRAEKRRPTKLKMEGPTPLKKEQASNALCLLLAMMKLTIRSGIRQCTRYYNQKDKGKVIPLQARCGPEGR